MLTCSHSMAVYLVRNRSNFDSLLFNLFAYHRHGWKHGKLKYSSWLSFHPDRVIGHSFDKFHSRPWSLLSSINGENLVTYLLTKQRLRKIPYISRKLLTNSALHQLCDTKRTYEDIWTVQSKLFLPIKNPLISNRQSISSDRLPEFQDVWVVVSQTALFFLQF